VIATRATGRRYWYTGPNPLLQGRRCVCVRWGDARGNALVMFRRRELVIVHGRSCLRRKRPVRKGTRAGEYPVNWPEIAMAIKAAAGWKCEHCGHPDHVESGHVLTVHHLDLNPSNCKPDNLVALCQRCHLHWQARFRPGQRFLPGIEIPAWLSRRGLA
jgi:5-methylcytosine-specific restriction endonuclease McrA